MASSKGGTPSDKDGVNPALPISPLPVAAVEPSPPAPAAVAVKKSHGELLTLQAIAGASAGAVAKTATAPLERIKIIFQVQGMGNGGTAAAAAAPKYRGILQTAALVTREEGPFALWKGNGANVLRVIPVYGLKFAFNDTFKALVAGPGKKKLDPSELLWVGTLAGLAQTIITYPLETVRTRLSLGEGQGGVRYKGIVDCFRQMVRTEGVSGLYKGTSVTLISGAPYTGIQMTCYELLQRSSPDGGKAWMWPLINGAFAGLVAQTVTYPGDTVRRRMQTNGAGGAPRVYRNSWDCTMRTFRNEGLKGFFRGNWTNTVRAVPGAAIQFLAYERFKEMLDC